MRTFCKPASKRVGSSSDCPDATTTGYSDRSLEGALRLDPLHIHMRMYIYIHMYIYIYRHTLFSLDIPK